MNRGTLLAPGVAKRHAKAQLGSNKSAARRRQAPDAVTGGPNEHSTDQQRRRVGENTRRVTTDQFPGEAQERLRHSLNPKNLAATMVRNRVRRAAAQARYGSLALKSVPVGLLPWEGLPLIGF